VIVSTVAAFTVTEVLASKAFKSLAAAVVPAPPVTSKVNASVAFASVNAASKTSAAAAFTVAVTTPVVNFRTLFTSAAASPAPVISTASFPRPLIFICC
jgi:hypothetical protein